MAKYTEEFKRGVVALVDQGTAAQAVANEYGVSPQTVRNWVEKYSTTPETDVSTGPAPEIVETTPETPAPEPPPFTRTIVDASQRRDSMAAQNDFPAKVDGKLYRFISVGEKAALFDKTGLVQRLTVTEIPRGRSLPKVVDEDGNPVTLARRPRPCSCKGAPWSTRFSTLAEEL